LIDWLYIDHTHYSPTIDISSLHSEECSVDEYIGLLVPKTDSLDVVLRWQ